MCAVVQFGTIVTGMKGSVGGNTFSRGGSASVMKRKPRSPDPIDVMQLPVKNAMARFAPSWRLLSSTVRANWANYALTVTLVNSLGQSYKLTGFQMFIRNQQFYAQRAAFVTAAPPTSTGLPVNPTLTFDYNAGNLRLVTATPAVLGTDDLRMSIFTPSSPTLQSPKGMVKANFRYQGAALPVTLVAAYATGFAAGLALRAFILWRFADTNQRVGNPVLQFVDFTV